MTEYINTIFQFLMEDTFRKLSESSGKEASKFLFPVKIGTPHAASVSNTKLSLSLFPLQVEQAGMYEREVTEL